MKHSGSDSCCNIGGEGGEERGLGVECKGKLSVGQVGGSVAGDGDSSIACASSNSQPLVFAGDTYLTCTVVRRLDRYVSSST